MDAIMVLAKHFSMVSFGLLPESSEVVYPVHDFTNSWTGYTTPGRSRGPGPRHVTRIVDWVYDLEVMYRELYRASNTQSLEIAGPLMLLQVWAYDRFSIVAPQKLLQHSDGRPLSFRWSGFLATSKQSANMLLTYRWTFDRLRQSQTPYTPDIMASLPLRCCSGQAVWTYVGPLICFHLVKKHQPDCVLRQFNML
uniref:Aminotransferase-like plant mobile domain-containing protein n=1 Tax=Cucumis melo TaxID=3656 RepID=A0A9I9E5K6_CUCME